MSGRLPLTPKPRAARLITLRPLVGRSVICCSLISVLTTLESACTVRASAWTVMVCDSCRS